MKEVSRTDKGYECNFIEITLKRGDDFEKIIANRQLGKLFRNGKATQKINFIIEFNIRKE